MRFGLLLSVLLLLGACGTHSEGGMSGPTMTGRIGKRQGPVLQSNDILDRGRKTKRAKVRHVLIGWGDLEGAYSGGMDPRAKKRSRLGAERLTRKLFKKAKAGESFLMLMAVHSEDRGSKTNGRAYEITPDAAYAKPFIKLGLRLRVGEIGIVQSQFGWHIMKRVE
jgi:peptidyl-prolyl cis-trans isomerase D